MRTVPPLDYRVLSNDPADRVDECHEDECHQHKHKKKQKSR